MGFCIDVSLKAQIVPLPVHLSPMLDILTAWP